MSAELPEMLAADFIHDEPDPFHWRMGVHPLELDKWLIKDGRFEVDLAELRLQLAKRRDEIIYCEEGFEERAQKFMRLFVLIARLAKQKRLFLQAQK